MSESPAPNSVFRFYDLPPELRAQILKNLLLSKTRFVDPGDTEKGPISSYVPRQPYVSSTILRVNRQIYTQGLPMLYSQNGFRFVIGPIFRNWVDENADWPSRKLITDLIVHVSIKSIVEDLPGIDGRRTLLPLTEANFPCLEKLTLAFQDPCSMDPDLKKEWVRRIRTVEFKRGLKEFRIVGLKAELKELLLRELGDLTV